jgi:hypothetical protein
LEFGIGHTGSATIDGDDSIEEGTHADDVIEAARTDSQLA